MEIAVHKPTLRYLCAFYEVDALALALASNVSLPVVLAVQVGYAMTRETAEAILHGINILKGTQYRLDNVCVDLVEGSKQVNGND